MEEGERRRKGEVVMILAQCGLLGVAIGWWWWLPWIGGWVGEERGGRARVGRRWIGFEATTVRWGVWP